MKKGESLLEAGGATLPIVSYPEAPLEESMQIPDGARIADPVIAVSLVNIDGASQMALLASLHQCYQPEISLALRTQLNRALDWSFRLQQLMLQRGWVPEVAKVAH